MPGGAGYTAAMRRFPLSRLPLVLSLALLLAACGNKGPLVLPTPADEIEEIDEVEEVDELEDVETDDGDRTEAVEEVIEETTEVPVEDGDPVEVPPPPADPGNG